MCKPIHQGKTSLILGNGTRNVLRSRNGDTVGQRLPIQHSVPRPQIVTHSVARDAPPTAAEDTSDAMRYVAEVRQRFVSEPNKYTSFLLTFSMYRNNRLNLNTMFDRLAIILSGHRDLLEQFVNFLPNDNQDEFRVRLQNQRSTNSVRSGAGATFMQTLQCRFSNEPQKYRRFVFILDSQNIGLLSPQSFIKETLHFLSDHHDIMLQFCDSFVPEEMKAWTMSQIRDIIRFNRRLRSNFTSRHSCPSGITFHMKVKQALPEEKYKIFYKFFETSLGELSDVSIIVDKIMPVFEGHPDLRREVIPFLPRNCRSFAWNKIRESVRTSRRLRNLST